MSDQQQSGRQTGQLPLTGFGNVPASGEVPLPSSGISFKESELSAAGGQIDGQTALIGILQGKAAGMGVPFPGFGVIGMGFAGAHDKAIERQTSVLEQGKKALDSWKGALKDADTNYSAVEEKSGNQFGGGGLGGGGLGGSGLDPSALGGGPGLGGLPAVGSGGLPTSDLPKTDLPSTDLPSTDLPDAGLPNTSLPNTSLPNTGLPDTDLPDTDLPRSNLPGVDNPDMKVPSIDSALNPDQVKTDLSAFDPPKTQLNVPTTPGLDDVGTRSGTTLGSPTVTGAGGVGSTAGAGGLRAAGTGAGALGSGMPMMPMMPMSGAGTGGEERDREGNSLLSEDEGVWGGDEDIAPEVIGREK